MKLSCRIVTTERTPVFTGAGALTVLEGLLRSLRPARVFILTDRNTRRHCLPVLVAAHPSVSRYPVLEIAGGEEDKTLSRAEELWGQLLEAGAERTSVLLNLGGGVLSDLGGFVAAGYKRGIRYLNLPTSLIGMADAAVGGKTGVNAGHAKNQVGFFYAPSAVVIHTPFLDTLPPGHLRAGMAEIIKTALVGDASLYRRIRKRSLNGWMELPARDQEWQGLVTAAVQIKMRVVKQDYRERKQRKMLNFGHTVGHALEALSLEHGRQPILHGDAVAAGMICAAWLSHTRAGLKKEALDDITALLLEGFPHFSVGESDRGRLMELMRMDKKVSGGGLRFTLLRSPGTPVPDVGCNDTEVAEALGYYHDVAEYFQKSGRL